MLLSRLLSPHSQACHHVLNAAPLKRLEIALCICSGHCSSFNWLSVVTIVYVTAHGFILPMRGPSAAMLVPPAPQREIAALSYLGELAGERIEKEFRPTGKVIKT